MRVYVVRCGYSYEGSAIRGVFSNITAAREFKKQEEATREFDYTIIRECLVLDDPPENLAESWEEYGDEI